MRKTAWILFGANGVINVACEPAGVSMKKNCRKTLECRGDAVPWK